MTRALLCLLAASPALPIQPPVYFEANRGQTGPAVRFLARSGGATLGLTGREAVLAPAPGVEVRMRFPGANPQARIEGLEPLPGRSNYFIGNDPKQWRTDVPQYGKVAYRDLYPGVDLVFYGVGRRIEYDFLVAPGADPSVIALRFEDADEMRLAGGDLLVRAGGAEIRHRRPAVYQMAGGTRREIGGEFELAGGAARFRLDAYDPALPLRIDPQLTFSTYLGGGADEQATDVALDHDGNIYITGSTYSTDFPVKNAYQPVHSFPGERNVFVVKLNPTADTVLYATYLGGPAGRNLGTAIAVDSSGHAYVTGETYSTAFPTTSGAFQEHGNMWVGEDGFITKLSPEGNALAYSTYVAASGSELIRAIAVDAAGNAYITGAYWPSPALAPPDFPTTPGAFRTTACNIDGTDVFALKMNPAGSGLVYSTYVCGSGGESAQGLALDGAGNVFITGSTGSTDFPTLNAFQGSVHGRTDVFVTKINRDGSGLIYSTLLGGTESDIAYSIAVDAAGQAYVAGNTMSTDFPTLHPIQAVNRMGGDEYNGGGDVFLSKLSAAGDALLYSTFLGGTQGEFARTVVVDAAGSAYVAGTTKSSDFPVVNSMQAFGGQSDAFVARVDPAGTTVLYSTFLGGSGSENFLWEEWGAAALYGRNSIYVVGGAWSADFPLVNPLQPALRGDGDIFLSQISEPLSPHVSSASYQGVELAPEEIASAFGVALANGTEIAAAVPLPTTLAGASLTIQDSAGAERQAPLFFASSGQINYQVPPGVAVGSAQVRLHTAAGSTLTETVRIAAIAPGLYSANASSEGVASATTQWVRTDGTRSDIPEFVFRYDSGLAKQVTVPIDLGPEGQDVYLTLYGTGLRSAGGAAAVTAYVGGEVVPVSYAGAQGGYVGLDQVNLKLPRSLAGKGVVGLALSVAGKPTNMVEIEIR